MADSKPTKTTKPAEAAPKSAPPAATPVTPNHTSNKKVFIIVGAVVFAFVILPMLAVIIFGFAIGNHLSNNGLNIDSNKGTVTVKGKNGDEFTAGTTKSLPKDFPQDADVYDDDILSSGKITENGKTVWTVTIATTDSPAVVAEALTTSYTTDGWTTSMNNSTTDGGLLVAKKGEMQANVYYSAKDGKTTIVYTVGQTGTTAQ